MKTIKKILTDSCVFFTVGEFIILLAVQLALGSESYEGDSLRSFLSLGSASLVLLASFLLALFNRIFQTKLATSLKYLLHYAGCLTTFLIIFVFIPGNNKRGFAPVLLLMGAFTLIYVIVALVVVLIAKAVKTKKNEELEYDNVFDSDNK